MHMLVCESARKFLISIHNFESKNELQVHKIISFLYVYMYIYRRKILNKTPKNFIFIKIILK